MVKELWQKAASHTVLLLRTEWSLLLHAVIEDDMPGSLLLSHFWRINEWSLPLPLLKTEWSLLLHIPQHRLQMLFNGRDNPRKLPIPVEGSQPPSKPWFLGPTQVSSPNGISIDSAVSAGHIRVSNTQTDRQIDTQADHATCIICSNRLHLCNACNTA